MYAHPLLHVHVHTCLDYCGPRVGSNPKPIGPGRQSWTDRGPNRTVCRNTACDLMYPTHTRMSPSRGELALLQLVTCLANPSAYKGWSGEPLRKLLPTAVSLNGGARVTVQAAVYVLPVCGRLLQIKICVYTLIFILCLYLAICRYRSRPDFREYAQNFRKSVMAVQLTTFDCVFVQRLWNMQ
jgi:hypothetical protein